MPPVITNPRAEWQKLQLEPINLFELEMKAHELLPQTVFDHQASGANDEITLRENRAVACGARAVFIGRPTLLGLASGAEAGVRYVLEMLRQESDLAMALSGCPTLSSITRDLIRRS
ncbi:MAG TPA: alpha-hydroxy-acid oxidizing protein [Chthoniobacterales bacterium]|nr:alpha-hydroxy-acid oxidizing protein [Chthoniobacterales bacterium]